MKRKTLKFLSLLLVVFITLSTIACTSNGLPSDTETEGNDTQDSTNDSTSDIIIGTDAPTHADSANDGDHLCDCGCGATLSLCKDANLNHTCDDCGIELGEHMDKLADGDHVCDYGCGVTLTLCTDTNTDHICDDCGTDMGIHTDKPNDGDHACDYGCGHILSTCTDADNNKICDDCGATLATHEDKANDGDHLCDCGCGKTLSDCYDTDDHKCDECNKDLTSCNDGNNDHKCDLCGDTSSACADENKNHKCDVCDAEMNMNLHVDGESDTDHLCDYGCGAVLNDCFDDDNHKCNVCQKTLSTCNDSDLDHKCELCNASIGTCEDKDLDHDCDYGCNKFFGTHSDGDDADHLCDYGCNVAADDGCHDSNADGICDECDTAIDHTCADNDDNHNCDICSAPLTQHVDPQKDHICDICDAEMGVCEDKDLDHDCDYGCIKTFGTHSDGDDADHFCDYGCNVAADDGCHDSNADGICDECDTAIDHTCADNNNDHNCDICSAPLTQHVDSQKDHACDICDAEMGVCEDKDFDHDCDYGCNKIFGTHSDGDDADHLCDYGCNAVADNGCHDSNVDGICDECDLAIDHTCADNNNDHNCDICSAPLTQHVDSQKDHACDICDAEMGVCEDKDFDHDCDYGCDKFFDICEDKNNDHKCDYGCQKSFGTCEDKDFDHKCDYGCNKSFGTCADGDLDHDCDYGCNKFFDICEDKNNDHKCDYGCNKSFGACIDNDFDHKCDYGCNKSFGTCADGDLDHDCDYGCDKFFDICEDKNNDHKCDYGCQKSFGACEDKDLDHDCDYGCNNAFGEHKDDACDGDHICDYGCKATLSSCTDSDNNLVCDDCGVSLKLSIFENGNYNVKFILASNATALDQKVYNLILSIFEAKTGVSASSAKASEGYNGPAIIIGSASYEESESEISSLSYGDARATLVNGKYVITYSNAVAAAKIVSGIRSLLKNKSASALLADSDWNLLITDVESRINQTFDSTGIVSTATLPKYEGKDLPTPLYAGQKSYIYINKNATLKSFDNYCAELYVAGFSYYTNNQIGNNQFATFVTEKQIINVMYFEATKEVRITTDQRGKGNGASAFDLPALSGEVSYTKTAEPSLTVVDLSATGYGGGMCFIYKLPNGKFFIIDSGINKQGSTYSSSAPIIYNTLKTLAGSEKIVVAGWLITHVHTDHIGGLYDMATASGSTYDKIRANVTIEQLIHNEPTDDVTKQLDQLADNATNKIWAWMNPIANAFNVQSVIKAHPGQVLHYAGIDITILASQDVVLDIHHQYPDDRAVGGKGLVDSNELSVVSQVSFNGKTVLMLGDALQKVNSFLANVYGSNLKSDILQAAHHGLNSTGADTSAGNPNGVNQLCNPDITIWTRGPGKPIEYVIERCALNKYLIENSIGYGAHDGNVTFDSSWKTKSKTIKEYAYLTNGTQDYK